MHRITKAHLDSFVASYGLEQHREDVQFEMFVNKSVLASKIGGSFELEEVTTGPGEDGSDGVAVILDEDLVVSKEDAESVFSSDRKNHDVEVVFIQAKRSDSFDLGDFLKFKESILRFINSDPYEVNDEVMQNSRDVFDVAIQNVPKIRGGKPSISVRYVTTGIYREPEALETAKNELWSQLAELGYFNHVDISFLGRDEITALWVSSYSSFTAELPMFSNAPLPAISGIEEAYLAVVGAQDLVEKLLVTDDGNLRTNVFEENVRAFLGVENPVNRSIHGTLTHQEQASRFPVLNNGITIVSPDVRVQGSVLHLNNYQIVNGCQTSNVLYETRDTLSNDIMVNLKIVETSNEDVFSELVRATNSQTKVEETQFISLRPIVKRVEEYFNTYEGQDGRIYFERRDKQYIGRDIPMIRTFSLNIAAKCVASMFLQRPDLAYRYPKQMFDQFGDNIFSDDTKECVFYAACLSLYRLHLLVASADIPQNVRKYKWHILVLVRAIVAGKDVPNLNANSMEAFCQKLINAFAKHGDTVTEPFQEAVSILLNVDDLTDDKLKRQTVMNEMLESVS